MWHAEHASVDHCEVCRDWPMYAREILIQIERLEQAMTSGNSQIDTDVQSLIASEATMASEFAAALADLKATNPTVDTTALDAITAKYAADAAADVVTPPAAPVTPTP